MKGVELAKKLLVLSKNKRCLALYFGFHLQTPVIKHYSFTE